MIRSKIAVAVSALSLMMSAPAGASAELRFVTHATYYAQATQASVEIDPNVFVVDANAPATSDAQAIRHAAGIRPARLADDASLPLYNADGNPLGISLGRWLSARGTATIAQTAAGASVHLAFERLLPFGVYSVFVSRKASANESDGRKVEPLDGRDAVTTFTAGFDGRGELTVAAPHPLRDADVIVLVFHSDGIDHHDDRGKLGFDAHEQLALSIPPEVGAQAPIADNQSGPDASNTDTPTPGQVNQDSGNGQMRDPGPITGRDPNVDISPNDNSGIPAPPDAPSAPDVAPPAAPAPVPDANVAPGDNSAPDANLAPDANPAPNSGSSGNHADPRAGDPI